MANYYGSARSNYFNVKDEEAFLVEMEKIPGIAVHRSTTDKGFCILSEDADSGGWPSAGYDDDSGEEFEIDIVNSVYPHLVDDEVAIFMECGAEKLRYIVGYAVAVNNQGDMESISLDEIYELGATLSNKHTNSISRCEY